MYYKIASILLNNEQKSDAASDIFIAQPDNHKEALVGKLFVMAEIQSAGNDAPKILEFLIKNINFNYYQNEKVILKERIETISLESIFESALTKTNKDLAEFITQEKLKISPYAFNVSICILYKNEIYFSGAGKNKSLLIYKEKSTLKSKAKEEDDQESIEYKISDVGETPESEALNINKLFSNVVSGKIPVGGYFLVINEALSEYLSNKQLIRIITKLSPAGAAEQIRNLLEQINSYVSFLGIIIKNTVASSMSGEELKSQLEEEIKIDDYRPEITRTEEKTEEIMTPAGIVNLKKWSKAISDKINPVQRPAAPKETKTSRGMFLLKEKIFFKKRGGFVSPEKTKDFFKKLGKLTGAVFSSIIKIFHRDTDAEPLSAAAAPAMEEKAPTVISGKKIKIILIVALICLAAFFINLEITNQRNKADAKLRSSNALISSIANNQDKIDADFIYGNKTEALQLFNLNKDLLAQIPAAVSKRQTVQALFDKQKAELLKIQNINNVSGLTKIADFSNLTSTANPQNLFFNNEIAYAGDNRNNAIFKIDVKQNIVTADYNLGIATSGPITFPSAGQDNNILYLSGNNIFQLDKTDKPSLLTIGLPSTPSNVAGLQAYSDKLYVLDKSLNQIFRFTKSSANSFVNPNKWLNQTANLASSSGLFIDGNGNLYVLYNNGQVEKYLKGKKQDLSLDAVNPAVTSASRLIVTADYFYVLEPAAKRLMLWNNKGVYLAQYIFTDLNNLKDFAVNDKDKQIYLLDGHSVYQMAIPTLK
jgi:hypothetical protein